MLPLKSSLTLMQLPSPSDLEMVSAEIDPSLLLCLIYHPPNSIEQLNSSLITYLDSLDRNKNIVIMGDLNFPEINWNIYSGGSLAADVFAEVVHGLNLTQIITGPTHHAGNTFDITLMVFNILIHVLTFHPTSHPTIICCNFTSIMPPQKHIQRLDYSKANWDGMNQFLNQYDFTLALSSNNTEFI